MLDELIMLLNFPLISNKFIWSLKKTLDLICNNLASYSYKKIYKSHDELKRGLISMNSKIF